jgi:hypothetical protein
VRAELVIRGAIGVVLCLVGLVWIGQGTNLIHGSGMSGEGQWAVIGAAMLVAGVLLLARAWRSTKDR